MSTNIWIGTAIARNRSNNDDYTLGPFTSPETFQKLIKEQIAESEIHQRIYDSYTLDLHYFDGWSDVLIHIDYDENGDQTNKIDMRRESQPLEKNYVWVAFVIPRWGDDGDQIIGVYSSVEAFEVDLENIRNRKYLGYADEFSDGFALEARDLNKANESSYPDIRREYDLKGKLKWIMLLENGQMNPYKQKVKKGG